MKWMKRNPGVKDVESYVKEMTGGLTIDQLNNPGTFDETVLDAAADAIRQAVDKGRTICIVGDYDADGIDSLCILALIMIRLKADYRLTIPMRMTDGYGLSKRIMQNLPDGCLLITVDNGITAIEQIAEAKSRGMDVVILDHHNAGDVLPAADIIMDPKAIADGWKFTEYCGAGISYKLAERMFPGDDEKDFIDALSCFACIGTVADVMPLIGENRNIVNRGLLNMNSRRCTDGLKAFLDMTRKEWFESDTVAFTLGPAINAPGRLEDEGGKLVVQTLLSGSSRAEVMAGLVIEKNTCRKDYTAQAMEAIGNGTVKMFGDYTPGKSSESAVFVYSPDIKEGLCGLIAGKLAESASAPAFVTTDAGNGIIKGSARKGGGLDVYGLLKGCEDKLITFGGHDEAAGFSFKAEDLEIIANAVVKASKGKTIEENGLYDFEMTVKEMVMTYSQICRIKPLGEGIPNPVIKITVPSVDFSYIGGDSGTLRISSLPVQMIGFSSNGIADKFRSLGEPKKITVYGQMCSNWYRKKSSPQFQIMDLEA